MVFQPCTRVVLVRFEGEYSMEYENLWTRIRLWLWHALLFGETPQSAVVEFCTISDFQCALRVRPNVH